MIVAPGSYFARDVRELFFSVSIWDRINLISIGAGLLTFPEDSFFRDIAKKVRPGYIAAGAIVLGYIIGILGDQIYFCNLVSSCSNAPYATELLAQQNVMVYSGAYWQLFTSIFVTDSFLDAAFNAIAVLVLDFFLPDTMNNTRYFGIFLSTALLGNILTLAEGANYASAGASGGIFGVFAAAFAYNWAENKRIDLSTLVLFVALFVGSSFLTANVNWISHLGGSIGGFILGPLLYDSLKQTREEYGLSAKSSFQTRLIVVLFILVMVVGSTIQFILFVMS